MPVASLRTEQRHRSPVVRRRAAPVGRRRPRTRGRLRLDPPGPWLRPRRNVCSAVNEADEDRDLGLERITSAAWTSAGRRAACRRSGRWGSTAGLVGEGHLADGVAADRAGQPGAGVHPQPGPLLRLERRLPSARWTGRPRRCRVVAIAACSRDSSPSVSRPAGSNGESLATCRISSEYALPTPASSVWSVSTPLSWPPCALQQLAEPLGGDRGVERVRAEPGDAGHVGRPRGPGRRASRFWVPCSVRSKPVPSSRRSRAAIGPRPGFGGAGGSFSRQCSQPARARWMTRCSASGALGAEPPISMSRNLPCRPAPVTSSPAIAVGGGSNVFSALNATMSSRATAWPTARSRRNAASASTSGSSGTASSVPDPRSPRHGDYTA